ncbi:MAG: hypothetical protein AAF773_16510 [Cyanobacteria bacterium P01_D01_bin.115]
MATAPNPDNAVAFLEFLVSPEAQTVFAEGNNEYPVVARVEIDPIAAELGEFKVDALNLAPLLPSAPETLRLQPCPRHLAHRPCPELTCPR